MLIFLLDTKGSRPKKLTFLEDMPVKAGGGAKSLSAKKMSAFVEGGNKTWISYFF